jgi:hypothetical protein
MSRLIFSAVLAFAAFATSVESFAADYREGRHHYSRHGRSHDLYLYDHGHGRRHVGGYLFGRQLNASVFGNNGYNFPGYYSNQSFWDRVQSQANYPVQY